MVYPKVIQYDTLVFAIDILDVSDLLGWEEYANFVGE